MHGLLVGGIQGSPSILRFPTMAIPRAHHQGAPCSCSEPGDPGHTRWPPAPAPGPTAVSWARQHVLPLRGPTQSRPRPPAGSEAAPGAQDPQLRVKGSGRHQAPPASPGAEEGRPPSPPRAPLRLPAASPAPPLLFPKSTPLTMTFLSAPGLLSTALLQRPPPPDQRPSIRRGRGPIFLDQTLTSLSCLQPL